VTVNVPLVRVKLLRAINGNLDPYSTHVDVNAALDAVWHVSWVSLVGLTTPCVIWATAFPGPWEILDRTLPQSKQPNCYKIVSLVLPVGMQMRIVILPFTKLLCFLLNLQCCYFTDQVEHVLPFLRKGIGIHHSGLLPLLKETIEILFSEGLIKVCSNILNIFSADYV